MQTYAQRTIQARIRDASVHLVNGTTELSEIGSTAQYEPYYLTTQYETFSNQTTGQVQTKGVSADGSDATFNTVTDSTRTRVSGGFQQSSYNMVGNGI